MSKCTYTGLFSDEAYDALTFVSALRYFIAGAGEAFGPDEGIDEDEEFFDLKQCFKQNWTSNAFDNYFCDVEDWGFLLKWYDYDEYEDWKNIGEITRNSNNGEVIINDFYNPETNRCYKCKSSYIFDDAQVEWANETNEAKLKRLSGFIKSAEIYLRAVFKSEEVKFDAVGPCWMEPENYHGCFGVGCDTLRDYPERSRHFHIKLSALNELREYFSNGGKGEVSEELRGTPWLFEKAASYAIMRKKQNEIFVKGVDIIREKANAALALSSPERRALYSKHEWIPMNETIEKMIDEVVQMEKEQKKIEDEWRSKN